MKHYSAHLRASQRGYARVLRWSNFKKRARPDHFALDVAKTRKTMLACPEGLEPRPTVCSRCSSS